MYCKRLLQRLFVLDSMPQTTVQEEHSGFYLLHNAADGLAGAIRDHGGGDGAVISLEVVERATAPEPDLRPFSSKDTSIAKFCLASVIGASD